jgi:F-type H+-transporting ATPase subunit a
MLLSHKIKNETKIEKRTITIIIIIFMIILLYNIIAIYPSIFSITSHLFTNVPLSVCLWIRIVLFSIKNKINSLLSHIVPIGTPRYLIPMIVIIEITRNLIRPITLCVRITANMISGHLLISLLGITIIKVRLLSTLILIITPILLTIIEIFVSFIQAYVFVTLLSLYVSETK